MEPGPAGAQLGSRFALLAPAALVAALLPIAIAGAALVQAGDGDPPRWVLGLFGSGIGLGGGPTLALLAAATAAWAATVALAERIGLRVILLVFGVLGVAFALAPPLLTLDPFSYLAYARIAVEHGLDPYAVAPADVPGDPAADLVRDFAGAPSVYGPAFTLATYPLGLLSVPAGLWSMKALALAAVAALAAILVRAAPGAGVAPARAVAVCVLNPVVLVHVLGGPHNDVLVALSLAAAAWLVAGGLPAAAGLALAGGIAVKVVAVVGAALALAGGLAGRPVRRLFVAPPADFRRLAVGLGAGLVVAVALGVALYGGDVLGALEVVRSSQAETSYHSVPGLAERALGLESASVATALAVLWVVLVVALAWGVATARLGWIRAGAWAYLALIAASAYVAPWYLVWALPLVALTRDRWALLAALALTAYQLPVALP